MNIAELKNLHYICKEIDDLEKQLHIKRKYKERLLKSIDEIEDTEIRLLLQYRFVQKMTWYEVAAHISPYATPDSVRMRVKRFLNS